STDRRWFPVALLFGYRALFGYGLMARPAAGSDHGSPRFCVRSSRYQFGSDSSGPERDLDLADTGGIGSDLYVKILARCGEAGGRNCYVDLVETGECGSESRIADRAVGGVAGAVVVENDLQVTAV